MTDRKTKSPGPRDGATGAADQEAVRLALRKLLADSRFAATDRNRRFLAYVVEEELQGRGEHIRAYNVAVNVFQRPPGFDPGLDPIVRVEAGRLRQALTSYYEEAPSLGPWRILVPKGAYRPCFEAVTPRPAPAPMAPSLPAGRPWSRIAAAGLLALALAVVVWLAATQRDYGPNAAAAAAPAILVAPFTVLEGDEETGRLARGLTRDVVDRLSRFRSFDIYGPAIYQRAIDSGELDFARVADRLHTGYVVEGALRRLPDRLVINVLLKEQATGRYLWTYRADNRLADAQDLFASLFDIASQIASTLGQPLGIVNRSEWLRRQPHSMSAYRCVLQAHDYYRSIDAAGHAAARSCLEAAVAADPSYAAAWVMLAWVYLDEARYRLNPRPELYDAEARAREAVERALALDPEQEMALDALSVLQFRAGDMAAFRRTGEKMLGLNPNDPDLAADFGGRLAFSGDWDSGMPLVRRAIDLSIEPSGTYYMALAWDLYRRGDDVAALRQAERIRMPEFQMGLVTCAAIYGQLGMQPEAAETMGRLRRLRPDLADDPGPWLLGLHFEPSFATRLAEGVRRAARLAAQS